MFINGKYLCNWKELTDNELLEFERLSITWKDEFEMFLSLIEGIKSAVIKLFESLTELNPRQKNYIIASFFQQIEGIDSHKLPVSSQLRDKIIILRNDYQAFFDDIPKLLDPSSWGFLIVDSGFTHYETWFSIFRCSQWSTKEVFFSLNEFWEIYELVRKRLLILRDYSK